MALLGDARVYVKITRELWHGGRRTVSHVDWVRQLRREFDADFQNMIVDLLPEVARLLEADGLPCTLVNEYCLSNYAEIAITDPVVARRCNVFNSGGKRPVGIRRALPDDLVRHGARGSLLHLGLGGSRTAIQDDANDVGVGITSREQHQRLVDTLADAVPAISQLGPEAAQLSLMASAEDET